MAIVSIEPERAGRVLDANGALCELSGYSHEQLREMDISAFVHPDDLLITADGLRRLLDGEIASFQAEHRIITSAGRISWVALSTSLVRDGERRAAPPRRPAPGRLRAQALRGPAPVPRRPRLAHRPLQPPPVRGRSSQRELALATATTTGGALLVLDLDNFKYVNDSLGHSAGDELITSWRDAHRRRLRATDTVGRLGGDEFAVILPHATKADAVLVAARAARGDRGTSVAARRRTGPAADDRLDRPGAVRRGRTSGSVADELLVEADIAMYDAKETGRDRFALYRRGVGPAGRRWRRA